MNNQMVGRMDGFKSGELRRVEIFLRDDGLFQFLERQLEAPAWDSASAGHWVNLHRSGLYQSQDEAEREARKFLAMKRPTPLGGEQPSR